MKDGMQDLDEKNVDLISLDLDGNDLYFCENLLKSIDRTDLTHSRGR